MADTTDTLDVKPDTADSSPAADAIDDSSSSGQSTEADVNANLSMADFVAKSMEKTTEGEAEESSPSDEDKAAAEAEQSDSKNELDAEKKKDEGEKEAPESEEEATAEEGTSEADEPMKAIPYERFQEVVTEKTALKQNLDEVMPKVQNYENITNFCAQHEITTEQFDEVLQIQALLNTNPPEALKRLLPVVEALQGFVGNKLPTDLQQKVDTGKLELDDAKEIASLRAQRQFGEKKLQHDHRSWQQKQQAEEQRVMLDAAKTWESTKRTSDPDYKPKSKDKADEPDGKWEMVRDKFLAMLNAVDGEGNHINKVRTAKELHALQDRAYAAVNATWRQFTPKKPATRKPLLSGSSSTTTTDSSVENAPTMAEAVRRGLALRR